MELLNHYNDENDIEREECRKALRLLVKLCTKKDGEKLSCKFVFPMDTVLTHYFFSDLGKYMEEYDALITGVQKLCGNIPIREEENIEDFIVEVTKIINYEKNAIKDNYENYLKFINEGDIDWGFYQREENKQIRRQYFQSLKKGRLSYLVAMSFVIRTYQLLEKEYDITSEEFGKQTISFIENFYPILVMNESILDNIGQGVEKIKDLEDKRWNTIFDISLMFGVLYNPQGKENVKLITNDKSIIKSFEDCGYKDKAITLDNFLSILNLDI